MFTAVLVGCGAMSARWLDAISKIEALTIVGLVDVDVARAQARAAEFNLVDVTVGADLKSIVAAVRPDMVFDVVVPEARREVAITAFEAGCHLLTEKPLAASLDDARAILSAAKAHDRLHAVVQNRRYLAEVRRLKRFLASGVLGQLTGLHADFFLGPHFGGFREAMDHVLLLDMAIHTFDVARLLAGSTPTSVYCSEWQPQGTWYRSGSSAAAIFEFAGGLPFTYRGSWSAIGRRTSWESNWRFTCEHGSATWDGFDGLQAERRTGLREGLFDAVETVEIPVLDPSDRIGGHKGVIEDFLAAVGSGRAPETCGADNFLSLAMVFGAISSAETQARVVIPEQGAPS
ncbi:MAG: Gfo/Idh/MocA family oxidoreductase [Ancalomicrobiaceae bacterium]|nr:Gfo/Idh/MocA family oxidoreductase [Ancalomicrobiaceae bacterium]